MRRTLEGRAAVVTGGTFGVGRGIASALAQSGARVFVTGRSVRDGLSEAANTTGIRCDHRVDDDVVAAFRRVAQEVGAIDILVNNVWCGYERMMEDGHSPGPNHFGSSHYGAGTRCSLPASGRITMPVSLPRRR